MVEEVLGERDYEISIELSDERMRRYGLTFDAVVNAIQQRSRDLPGGLLRTDAGAITLRSTSQAYRGREFEQLTLISRDDGTRIRLGDIATVRDGFADQPVLSRVNGEPALTFDIDRVGAQDVLEITALVKDYVAEKRAELPEGIGLQAWGDQSRILRGRIELMLRNAATPVRAPRGPASPVPASRSPSARAPMSHPKAVPTWPTITTKTPFAIDTVCTPPSRRRAAPGSRSARRASPWCRAPTAGGPTSTSCPSGRALPTAP